MSKSITTFLDNKIDSKSLFFEALRTKAEMNPQGKAFTFFEKGEKKSLMYSELDQQIRRLAAYLQQKNLVGERALLLYPPGFDYIIGYFACLYSGVIAVPVYPPDPTAMEKTLPRLNIIAKDSDAKIALSTNFVIKDLFHWQKEYLNPDLSRWNNKTNDALKNLLKIEWFATDTFNEVIEDIWTYPDLSSNDIAYLQYTSGSTGDPKGVMITHENLIHNTKLIYHGFNLNKTEHEGVIWLPIYHDMGLVGGILEPILAGFHCTLLSTMDFLKSPMKWLSIISDIKDKVVVSGGPNFAYDLCLKAANPNKREELSLSNWKVAFTGAEPVRTETILQFSEAFKITGFRREAFYPCYGLAEGTLLVSGGIASNFPKILNIDKEELKNNKVSIVPESENSVKFVSCGTQILDSIIKIVNPESRFECDEKEVGEIWTMSKSNAKGYWKKSELSDFTFNAFTNKNEGPFLRTGDLGFILQGELFVTGRLKDVIIIRGSNHYPQDIELTVEHSNNMLRPGRVAAFSVDINNEEQLIIVQEVRSKQNVNLDLVCEDIRNAVLSAHGIIPNNIVLIKSKTILKTSSGKIQRNANKQAYLNSELDIICEWKYKGQNGKILGDENQYIKGETKKIGRNEIVRFIAEKLSKELNIPSDNVDKEKPISEYGFDSVKSLILVGELEEFADRSLEPTILWNYSSINKLADFLCNNKEEENQKSKSQNFKSTEEFEEFVSSLSDKEAEEYLLMKLNLENLGD